MLSKILITSALLALSLSGAQAQNTPKENVAIIAGVTGAPAAFPTLKERVQISGDTVTLGDLIDHAGIHANKVLFRAPALGQYGTIQAWRISEAAKSYGLNEIDTRNLEEVRVERLSRPIYTQEISQTIAAELAERLGNNDPSRIQIVLDKNTTTTQIDQSATAPLAIERLTHDPASGRFEASLLVPDSASSRRAPLRVYGTAMEMVEILRLNRSLNRGEAISESDLIHDTLPRQKLAHEAPLTAKSAIGMVVRRTMAEGTLLRANDLERARLVSRNDTVTIVYEAPGIVVTARGKALNNGTMGDVIDILNPQSKKTLQATITGSGKVSVLSSKPRNVAALTSSN